jgi:hypothetical protein
MPKTLAWLPPRTSVSRQRLRVDDLGAVARAAGLERPCTTGRNRDTKKSLTNFSYDVSIIAYFTVSKAIRRKPLVSFSRCCGAENDNTRRRCGSQLVCLRPRALLFFVFARH